MGPSTLLLFFFVSSVFATCPNGTIFDARFNKCYKFVTQPASFLLAERNCESLGGSLVTVSNAFENTFISGIAAYNESTIQFWIGINLMYYNEWTWVNGDNSLYRNWAAGQPTSGPRSGAIQVMDTLWTTAQYNSILPYMCQIDPNASPVNGCVTLAPVAATTARQTPTPVTTVGPTSPVSGACPNGHCADAGYTLNPNTCKCYKYNEHNEGYVNLSDAEDYCSNENATLPIILSGEDNHFVANIGDNFVWLGLHCTSNSTTSCTWQDGSPLQGYNNFSSGYPHPHEGGYLYAKTGGWGTTDGWHDLNTVCQKNGIP